MRYKVESPVYVIDEGTYMGELIGVSERTMDYGPTLMFSFKILTPDVGDGVILNGLCSANEDGKLLTGSKLYRWLCVLNGANFDDGEEVDPENFVGSRVELIIENTQKNGWEFSNVKTLVRLVDPTS